MELILHELSVGVVVSIKVLQIILSGFPFGDSFRSVNIIWPELFDREGTSKHKI